MPRLTNLKDVLFPVAEHSVFVSLPDGEGERRVSVPEKKAIVNMTRNRVLGIVSRDYRLVSNQEALDWAFQCCRTVFPETKPAEWEVSATDAPSTGGHCTIDLRHNSTVLDFTFVPAEDRPEAFGPFIRVTNSYNGLRALGFDIGFYRKVCKNGLIVPDSIVQFKFTHLRRDLGATITFDVARDRLAKVKSSFREYLGVLTECAVALDDFVPLLSAVMLIKQPVSLEPESADAAEWTALDGHLHEISNRYFRELGGNAYAVFNAITDFASHPPSNRLLHRDRHSLQRRAGAWLNDFSQKCRQPDFDLNNYTAGLKDAGSKPRNVSADTSAAPSLS